MKVGLNLITLLSILLLMKIVNINLIVKVFEEIPEASWWGIETNQRRPGEGVFRPKLDGCREGEGVRIFEGFLRT